MWNERDTGDYFGSNSHTNKLSDTGQKPGGGESTADSVVIHTCLVWFQAAIIFSDYLA
jgi:hypothetical protein